MIVKYIKHLTDELPIIDLDEGIKGAKIGHIILKSETSVPELAYD